MNPETTRRFRRLTGLLAVGWALLAMLAIAAFVLLVEVARLVVAERWRAQVQAERTRQS